MKTEITRGTVVLLRGGRYNCHAVVASSRYVSKGRQAGTYECKLGLFELGRNGKAVYVTANEHFLHPATKQYTAEQIAKAIDSVEQIKEKRAEHDQKRYERRSAAMREIENRLGERGERKSIEPGDEVLIRYTDVGACWEKVGAVKEGKIGIEKRNIEAIRVHNEDEKAKAAAFEYQLGINRRARTKRELRWLSATLVKDIRKAPGNTGKSADSISIDAAQLSSAIDALSSAQEAALATV